jgi:para-nitrobenzyl esterase
VNESTAVIAATSTGRVVGSTINGIDRFLGIPFAAAPFGARRFALPQPHEGWDGERDATRLGATVPQSPYPSPTDSFLATIAIEGDEVLNLNIWAPSGAHDLPVIVWVHGGGLNRGSNALDGYDGTAFARDGVVFVSVNHRLGTEGFSVLEGAPANLGMADVMAALRWVRSEIAAFGGAPNRVTAVGQSAGAGILGAILARPDASTFLDRVVLQSGLPSVASPRKGGRITRLIAKRLGVPPTRTAFAAIPPQELVAAAGVVLASSSPLTGGPAHSLILDGELISEPPVEALANGAAASIPLLVGLTSEEYRLWLVPTGLVDRVGVALFAAARVMLRLPRRVVRTYRRELPGASRGELFGHLVGDKLIGEPIDRIATARARAGSATWVFDFAWHSPVGGLGAAHTVELGFVFDRLRSPDWRLLVGDAAPQGLADEVHGAWVRFASEGDPGWDAWTDRENVKVFDDPESERESPLFRRVRSWRS